MPGAVQRMESALPQLRRVANVMQPGRTDKSFLVEPSQASDAARLPRNYLHVLPPTRQTIGEQTSRQMLGAPDCE
jgi:hypothetical protein